MSAPLVLSLPPGLHTGIPSDEYHRRIRGVASKHGLDEYKHAPSVHKAWLEGVDSEDEDKEPFRVGNGFDCALLEPDRFAAEYAVQPDFGDLRYVGAKDKRKAWLEEHGSKTPLSEVEGKQIAGMVRAVHAHRLAGPLVRNPRGIVQPTILWDDPETGLRCKARLDLIVPTSGGDVIVDVKSTRDPRRHSFARDAKKYGYHRQEAFYRDGLFQIRRSVRDFLFVAVRKREPYLVAVYRLSDEDRDAGAEAIGALLRGLAESIATDKWPGLSEGIEELTLPRWGED